MRTSSTLEGLSMFRSFLLRRQNPAVLCGVLTKIETQCKNIGQLLISNFKFQNFKC